MDSNKINKNPNKIPPDDIKEVQKSTKEFIIFTTITLVHYSTNLFD